MLFQTNINVNTVLTKHSLHVAIDGVEVSMILGSRVVQLQRVYDVSLHGSQPL